MRRVTSAIRGIGVAVGLTLKAGFCTAPRTVKDVVARPVQRGSSETTHDAVVSFLALAILACVTRPASAEPVRWVLQDVAFGGCSLSLLTWDGSPSTFPTYVNNGVCTSGGTLSGYIEVDNNVSPDALQQVVDWSITVSEGDETQFPATVYTKTNSSVVQGRTGGVGFAVGSRILSLNFAEGWLYPHLSPLTLWLPNSYEFVDFGSNPALPFP